MAEIIRAAGAASGGGAVILRAVGQAGNEIIARLGEKTVSGTVGEGGAVQLALPDLGLWRVTTRSGDYDFEQEVKVYRYGITECWALGKKPLNECTWEEIGFIGKSGLGKQFWSRGDIKQIQLTTGEEVTLVLADFDHDVDAAGRTIPLTFIMQNLLDNSYRMNASLTSKGGWEQCEFRTSTLPNISATFPDDLKKVVTTCCKKTASGETGAVLVDSYDDFWLLSVVEILGEPKTSLSGEGTLYPVFTDADSRIKTQKGVKTVWFTRSPENDSAGGWFYTSTAGDCTQGGSNRITNKANGILLGFCVG